MTRGVAALLGLCALLASGAIVQAASLQRLTVTRLILRADTASPKLEVPFHLIVAAHVVQRVTELDNLDLPILSELELLGDERRLITDATGTSYRETITVVAHHTGSIHIDPVTLAAIDARDGRGKRYFSNDLTIRVGGGTLEPFQNAGAVLRGALRLAVRAVVILLGLIVLMLTIGFALSRRRRPSLAVVTVAPPPSAPPPPPRDRRAELREALASLERDPSRAGSYRARSAIRRMVGATDGETLADVMHRPLAVDPTVADVLRTLERAAFTFDGDLAAAIRAAVAALERALA